MLPRQLDTAMNNTFLKKTNIEDVFAGAVYIRLINCGSSFLVSLSKVVKKNGNV